MTLLLVDGCEDNSSWQSGSGAASAGYGRNGLGVLSWASPAYVLPTGTVAITVGLAFRYDYAANSDFALVDITDNAFLSLRMNVAAGALRTYNFNGNFNAPVAAAIPNKAWCYVEWRLYMHATAGYSIVRVNGTQIASATNINTIGSGGAPMKSIQLQTQGGVGDAGIDDVYIATSTTSTADAFLGDITVETLYPNGDGAANQWLGSDGNSVANWQQVDEVPVSTADYNASSTVGQVDEYALSDLTHTTGTIVAVTQQASVALAAAGSQTFALVNRRTTDTVGLTQTCTSTGYGPALETRTVDPETGAAWTIANVNALQTGVKTGLPGGLRLWLDADDAATFIFSSGAVVSQWSDKSGVGNHLNYPVPVGNQPSRIAAAQNGRAAVRYDGVNDWLRTTNNTVVSSAVDNLTMVAACKRTGGGATQSVVFHNGAPSTNGYGLALRANGGNIGVLQAAVGWSASTTPDPAAPGVLVLQRNAGTWGLWLDGTATSLAATFTPSVPTAASEVTSDSHVFGGDVYEVMFFDRVLPTADRQMVESYLRAKWGTP